MYRISVLVLTFNHEKFILDNLKSIDRQIISEKVEVLICNDCSTDRTQEIIEDFLMSKQNVNVDFKTYCHIENLGMQRNFFWGFSRCSGEFVAICDGDDYWLSEYKLSQQYELLIKNRNIGMVFTGASWFDDERKVSIDLPDINRKFHRTWNNLEEYVSLGSGFLNSPTFFFRKALVSVLSNTTKIESTLWDLYIVLSILKKKSSVYYMDINSAVYRVLPNSVSHKVDKSSQFAFFRKKLNTELLFLESDLVKNYIKRKFFMSYFEFLYFSSLNERLEAFYLCFNKKSRLKLISMLFKLNL